MKRYIWLGISALVLAAIGSSLLFTNSARANSNNLESGYVAATPLAFAGENCVPSAPLSSIQTTYTYPDGVHPVAQQPNPATVAAYKSGQEQIQNVASEMEAAENNMTTHNADNQNPYQSILNSYVIQYDNLLAQYDTCTPNN